MSVSALAAWVLSVMVWLQPQAPWRESYEDTSKAIAQVSYDAPLFEDDAGRMQTAALFVSVAWFESHFQPGAVGDCGHPGLCKPGEIGKSHGLYQVQGQGDLLDTMAATWAAHGMLKASLKICRARPLEERLAWYAGGGHDCAAPSEDALRKSAHRVRKAMWIFKHKPLAGSSAEYASNL